jgi:hypothetical protein
MSYRLVMVVKHGALIAFVVAAVMNFFNWWRTY